VARRLDILNMTVDISIVLPAYNESKRLEESVKRTIGAVKKFAQSYEIIIAEDGSTDGTDRLSERLAKIYPNVKHLHSEKRLGRGLALKNAFRESKGKIIVYMDVDLATDLSHLRQLYETIKDEGYDLATGSRMLNESMVERSSSRQISSEVYNFMVRHMLGSRIRDHQCGFKAFRRKIALKLIDKVSDRHWFWDTEMLVMAYRSGYRIKEIPIKWKGGKETKVNVAKDSISMGWKIVRLWFRLNFRF
jgi:glycosyltransferase AglD